MRPMRRHLCLIATLFLAASPIAVLDAATAAPGVEKPAAAAAAQAPAAVEPIAAADIPARADADERYAQEGLAHARQADPADKLVPQLDALAARVRKLSETFKSDELQSLSAIRLQSLERHWKFYDTQLAEWRGQLQRITARYSEDVAELARRRATWEATRSTAGGLAPALGERVDSTIAEITRAERALSVPLDRQLRLAHRGNSVQQAIDSGTRAVGSSIAYFDRRLLMIDAPPLWDEWQHAKASEQGLSGLVFGLQIESDFLAEYNATHVASQRVLHLAALILLPLLVWLSRRSRKLVSDDPELQASAQVLLRPISAWLVLVLVGVLFFEPNAPMIRHQSALLLALIPVLRLLPRKVYAALGPWPYIVTALYLLYQLGFLFAGVPVLLRLHVLAIGFLTLVALVWLLLQRKWRERGAGQPATRAVVRAFGWAAAAALLVALVANLVGNTSLAEVLTGGVLDSGYVGLALYAGASVLNAVLALLLSRRGLTRFRVVTQHAGPLLQSLGRLVNVVAFATWAVIVLNEFRVYRPIEGWVSAVLTHPVGIGAISITLGSVLLFLVSVWVAFWLARTTRVVLRDEVLPKMELPRGVDNSVATLTYYGVLTLGVMIALAAAGFHVSQLAFVVGALGVGIGFGLQNVVNNFVSGLILMFERPIQPGDVIEVSGTSGKVREIGMRATTLKTFEGADVVVPNGTLLSEKLINWTLSDMDRRLDVDVGVAYGSDPKRVLALLEEVAKATPGVTSEPPPAVIFKGFGPSSLDFGLRAWTDDFTDWVAIRSALAVRVHDALAAAGISIPFPQHDLHLKSVSPEARAGIAGLAPGAPDA
jgi:potassium-dependent mechanosensitive channel